MLYGNIVSGKTHMATAIGNSACALGMSVGFYSVAALVNILNELYGKVNMIAIL